MPSGNASSFAEYFAESAKDSGAPGFITNEGTAENVDVGDAVRVPANRSRAFQEIYNRENPYLCISERKRQKMKKAQV